MSTELEQRAERIIDELLETPEGDRARAAERLCGGDAPLLERVRVLLAAMPLMDGFMSDADAGVTAAPPVPAEAPLTERVGTMIGRYKLLQQIGEGGFGVVYMAEQEVPVRRRVALKVIKAGMDTRAVIARFEAERQALAMMDHPNIARVLDAGATDTGRPYFVMELVKGIPITDYCDQASLDMRQRLALFMDVCLAVQHAHQKGVIHRDIKPSNVMVTLHDARAVVKVIDFGIAKATDQKLTEKTLFTNYGQMIGTPAYMSPEQAVMSGLDIDTRCDVYSLGVLLYELLAGSPPFNAKTLRSAGFDEMRRIIREEQPSKPSTKLSTLEPDFKLSVAARRQVNPQVLTRQLQGDLDWIVLKALEKERGRRYESASAFAQDIQRHLNSEPVTAGAPGTIYRLRKFLRRNRGPVAAVVVIVTLLLAGTAISTWQAVRATRAEKAARLAKLDALAQKSQAEANERLATDRLAQVAAERDAKEEARKNAQDIATFLGDVLRSPDPARDGRTSPVALGAKLQRLAGGFSFTEGPTSDEKGNIFFVDQPNDRIMEWSAAGVLSTFMHPSGHANGMCLDSHGNLIACADEMSQLWSIARDKTVTVLVKDYHGKLLNGPNDVWIRPDGGMYITDPFYRRNYWQKRGFAKQQETEGVYFLSPDRKTLTRVIDDFQKPNGIIGTPDGKIVYVSDIQAGHTYSYTIQPDGSLTDKTHFCDFGSDGMTIDSEGNVYTSSQGALEINDKAGNLIEKLPVPAANCCFGGADGHLLFITARREIYGLQMRTHRVGPQ